MQPEKRKLIIGSYPYRANVNTCRMLCEYLALPYESMFFNPYSWKVFKEKNTGEWLFEELPYLRDGGFVVTQAYPMCEYIIRKSGKVELLGKSCRDRLVVDRFASNRDLIQNILSLIVEHKNNSSQLMAELQKQW